MRYAYIGEADHNVFAKKYKLMNPNSNISPYSLKDCPFDPSLTSIGKNELNPLINNFDLLFNPKPQILVVSPLTRAIETGLKVVENRNIKNIVAHELCREKLGINICDRRRTRTELSKLYPSIDFSRLTNDVDETIGMPREKNNEIIARANKFMQWLGSPENDKYETIVVATHSAFLLALCSHVLMPHPDFQKPPSPGLGRWFETGEMRCYLIEWKDKNDNNQRLSSKM